MLSKLLKYYLLVAAFILCCSVPAAFADLVFIGTVEESGAGIGSEFTIVNAKLTGNATGTTEWAEVTFDGSGADVVNFGAETNVTGGANNQSWNLATDLGISQASQLALRLNVNETGVGTDLGVILDNLWLNIWDGSSVHTFSVQASDTGENYGGIIGVGSQGFLFALDAAQQAALDLIIDAVGAENIQVGAGFEASEASDGYETLNVARIDRVSVPEPMSLLLLGTGLLGVAVLRRKSG